MANEEVYAGGLLNRALDPATQPPDVKAYLQAEIDLLSEVITGGMALLDLGCGTGRHLAMFEDRLGLSVGVDYEHSYLVATRERVRTLSTCTSSRQTPPPSHLRTGLILRSA